MGIDGIVVGIAGVVVAFTAVMVFAAMLNAVVTWWERHH
jgi:hypothetical protein